ncbi:prepilin-type N-terminal cleavage/methylation domain-containing protein [Kamptonema cortianum]|nr:prepilin-type N-terminal cleavage/methylation domain-containing protein [Kamptonema cortianum]
MNNRRAFTLIELLVVIAIIAILAAIIFPVFARAKAAAKQTACISNLKQVGSAIGLYMADYDDVFPFAVDAIDKAQPQIWNGFPAFQALIPEMPLLSEVLQPYLKSKEVFHCPSDTGSQVLDDRPQIPFVTSPSTHAAWKSSYFFRTEIAFRLFSQAGLQLPANVNVLFDASGHWHGSGGPMSPNVTQQQYEKKLRGYRYNTLFGDLHVKSLTFDALEEAWNVNL